MGLDAVRNVKINFVGEDKSLGTTAAGIKSTLAGVAVVAAATGVAIKFMGDETERLDETAKAFDKSGLSNIETYQKLEQVAKLGGSGVEKLTKATVRLNRNLFAISQNSGKAAKDALEAIGLTAKDLAGLDETEQLGVLADALNGVADNGQRAALAEELLGRSGRDLLPVLKAGSDGLEAMVESIDKTFTREDLAKAEAYQDALTNLEKAGNDAKTELVLGLAPVFTEIADSMRESGSAADDVIPTITKGLKNLADTAKVVIDALAFSAEVWGSIGRVTEFVSVRFGRVSDAASDASDEIFDMVSGSRVGVWARESAEGLGLLGDESGDLTQRLRDQSPIVEELAQSYEELERAITGAEVAGSKLSLIGDAKKAIGSVLALGKSFEDAREDADEAAAARSGELVAQAEQSEFLAKLGAAEGDGQKRINERIVEGLVLRRQAAQLQFAQTQSTEDEAKLLAATRAVQLAQAQAGRGGGGGPRVSNAQRLVALGEQSVALLEQEAKISSMLAGDAEAEAAAEQQGLEARRARLQLERQSLELTKARGEHAKQELENKLAAKDAEIEAVDLQSLITARERELELITQTASIEQARSLAEAEAAARRFELLGNEFAAREVLRQQREQALLANPPEDEIGRIERMDELQQLAFDREMDRRQRSEDAAEARADLEEKLHADELKRQKEKVKATKAAVDASGRFLSTGQQFASTIIAASIKDEKKRARAELVSRGVMAIATGALEVVRGVAAAASFNPVQAALHAAAATLAFVQGGIMIGGGIPGRGSASTGSAAASAPRADRETGEAARTVESLPAVDREPARQPTEDQRRGAGATFNGDINVSVLGGLDQESTEKIRQALDDVDNGLESR